MVLIKYENMKEKIKSVSVVGLGKLGLPLSAALASRGCHVVGIDSDSAKVQEFNQGKFCFEPQLEDCLTLGKERLSFTTDLNQLLQTDITFVIVPTPSMADGSFSIEYVEQALERIGDVLRQKNSFHVVSVVSTVLPGSMEVLKAVLEKKSGKRCGQSLGLCYNPAFIALGNVIHNFLNPDFILIGESDQESGETLEKLFIDFCTNAPAIHRMNFINAEITKISLNTYVTMKISFGNTLARICEQLPGADAEVVAKALGSDSRVGPKYLRGALGYGGPCFPRDNRAFSCMGRKVGIPAFSAEATDRVNEFQVTWLLSLVKSYAKKEDVIGLWGLSYKPDTDVIEESQGMKLAEALINDSHPVVVYDPVAMSNSQKILGNRVSYADSALDCLRQASVLVIMTPWKEFSRFEKNQADFHDGKQRLIIDCWQILKGDFSSSEMKHVVLGKTL
mgnify:CR=1 FL=1